MVTNYKIGTYFNTMVNVYSKIIFGLPHKWYILKQVFKKKLKDNYLNSLSNIEHRKKL